MSVCMGVLMPLPLNGMGVGYTCGSLAQGIAGDDIDMTIVTPRQSWSLQSVVVVETLPTWARYVPYRWVRANARKKMESQFLSYFDRLGSEKSAAYLWPDANIDTIRELRRRDIKIFREQFNCHTGTAKKILDQAYRRLGVTPAHAITTDTVRVEQQILDEVNYIFCPSPMVEASLLENGVPSSKLLKTSYGWDPARLSGPRKLIPSDEGITAIFVGAICVRKGAHLLLEYWARSGVKGRLVLAGEMEPAIEQNCGHLLAREDVVVLDYFRDIKALYRSADVFLFPSLEEGSPLVIYEACGSGLPIVTTEMGAGRIVRNDSEGFVIDAYDSAAWIDAIRNLAADAQLRRRLSCGARKRSQNYIWSAVAGQRRQQILNIFSDSASNVPP